ncbi:MAG: glycerophosphodiester phosphodiesterase [Bryobacteraceae bacterium]|nr:glycerophosphodiester phosphodiesterase [Bryobacteraceae bacterium]
MRCIFALALVFGMTLSGAEKKIAVHGHRGARAVRPENTIPAFEYAIAQGVDVLELDLAVTKDNVVVVSHDSTINPSICTGPREHVPIYELTLAEVRAYDCGAKQNPLFPNQTPVPGTKMPTLDEAFDLAGRGTFEFNIETKILPSKPALTPPPEEFARLVLAAIRKHKLEKRVILQSFDFRTLHAMKKLAPEIRLSALYAGEPKDFTAIAREAGATIVSPIYQLITKEQVDAAHKAGLQVVPWTANQAEDWHKLVVAGVDAIITDDPAALISFLKKGHA